MTKKQMEPGLCFSPMNPTFAIIPELIQEISECLDGAVLTVSNPKEGEINKKFLVMAKRLNLSVKRTTSKLQREKNM